MEKPGTILLGNPANLVVSKVTQIAVLEKRYKVIDWIDDMKSNQLGQLHTIWDVSQTLVTSKSLTETIVNDIVSNIVPKAVDMHTRIVDEHSDYHEKANELRDKITTLVNEIKAIADTASGIDNVVSNGVVGVKRDQSKINAMRSKLLKIVQDNADGIDVSNKTFDETSDAKLSVQLTVALNKMDYNDIDQLANIDRTTDPKEEHMHIDNDDHADVTTPIYKFDADGEEITEPDPEPSVSVTPDPELSVTYYFSVGTTEVTSSNYTTVNNATTTIPSTYYTYTSAERKYTYLVVPSNKTVTMIDKNTRAAYTLTEQTTINISNHKVYKGPAVAVGAQAIITLS